MTEVLHTVGFTEKNAHQFFTLLENSGVKRVIDVRLNTKSQLAGFAKQSDLPYFLRRICGIDYIHTLELAPTKALLDAYKKNKSMSWENYENEFVNLLARRQVEKKLAPSDVDGGCFLCSEHESHHCHRRVAAEYLKLHWNSDIRIVHLT